MAEKLHNIALFGANGQIGTQILQALLDHSEGFTVTAFVEPGARLEQAGERRYVTIKEIDLQKTDRDDLAQVLQGHDAVVSALNGPALATQPLIQDAAADANVQRFYPSEYGMHHLYRKAGDEWAYMHAMWDVKNRANEQCLLHPAILEGKMSYTMIGCGDFYNQEREKVWCPWTQTDVKEYTLHAVISADAKADCTHLDDFAAFLVATLAEPAKSRNAHLNFVSDTVSTSQIATLLSRHSGKKAHVEVLSEEEMQRIVAEPKSAPKVMQGSAFPVDFWMLVKCAQGEGRFRRPPGQVHNDLFPSVKSTTFDAYLEKLHGKADSADKSRSNGDRQPELHLP